MAATLATTGGGETLASDWDGDSFEAALAAAPGSPERAGLIGDLIDAFFSALRAPDGAGDERYVSLDEGLAVMSLHAQTLGYDAVILFLDELILWLASHAADSAFLNREGQKVAKLVEAARADRPIPIVSFIARQRDLRELVGEHLPGAQQLGFADVLNWWEARFDRITLEDRNLPAIVERRVLRPKNDAARTELDAAFERTARVRDEVMSVLLTKQGDREMFRQVYPFTPALVQALIAVSSLLQRERTALKLMLQLLVDQAARLLGSVTSFRWVTCSMSSRRVTSRSRRRCGCASRMRASCTGPNSARCWRASTGLPPIRTRRERRMRRLLRDTGTTTGC